MKPTTMLFRNLMAMEVEESIRSMPFDAVVLLSGCDKTTAAMLLAAASANIPAIMVTGGPMLRGIRGATELPGATEVWRIDEEQRVEHPMTRPIDVLVGDVRIEHHRQTLGIGERCPRLSWKVVTDRRDWTQAGYEIELRDPLSGGVTSSGRVDSAEQILVPWPADELPSRSQRIVRVRVWGKGARLPSAWSQPSELETGLLAADDWKANLITPAWDEDPSVDQPAPLFRREFEICGQVERARLYITAHGVYEAELDGQRIGDHVLAPGWTSYSERLRYQTFDVGQRLTPGRHVIGVTVGDGWFRGRIGFRGGRRNVYGERLGLLAQLEIRYTDGAREEIVTDGKWRVSVGAIRSAGIYDGECYDARLEMHGWSGSGFDDRGWSPVGVESAEKLHLVAPNGPPVRRLQELAPQATFKSPSGRTIVDFGQNVVGRLRIDVQGPAGCVVTLRHAELLENGELCTRPLRGAAATDQYVLRGDPQGEVYEPHFTYHGFRYAELTAEPAQLAKVEVVAVVIHSDLEAIGWFECSDERLEQLHANVVWSARGNFFDIPTDCPQRDERLGWTGDIQVFAPTASFLYQCAGFLTSWLRDVASEQRTLGTVPQYVPFVEITDPARPLAAWGDAAVIVPWVVYQRFGDAEILRNQFDSMAAWAEQVASLTNGSGLWVEGFQLGDWLDPAAPPDHPGQARTDPGLIATGYHAYTAGLVSEAAAVLGDGASRKRYSDMAARARAAFGQAYVRPDGSLSNETATACALALQFDLLPSAEQRRAVGRQLVGLVEAAGHTIGTGFVGTPLICDALVSASATDTAYRLLMQTRCPSWLYPVTMGATTIWERWDSLLPDGSVNPGDMTSFNHYALGAVADWLYRTVAGLAPAAPGYGRLLIQPRPGGGLTRAAAAHETPYGRASVSWRRDGQTLSLRALVPPGTRALVRLPDATLEAFEVGSGQHSLVSACRAPADDPISDDSVSDHGGQQ